MNGYILESRTILESGIWKKPPLYFKVWHYLLLKSQFKDNGALRRGQLFTTIGEIAEACSYYAGYRKITPSRKEIWKILEYLRNPHEGDNEGDNVGTMAETTKVTHGIVVTICNYNDYQDFKFYEGDNEGDNEIPTKELRKRQRGNNKKKERENKEYLKNPPTGDKKVPPPYQAVVDMFNEECPSLPKVVALSDDRKDKIQCRLNEHTVDELRLAFQKAEASDFCTGRDGSTRKWCNFDWIINSERHLLKLLEGNFDNHNHEKEKLKADMQVIYGDMSQEEYEEMERTLR